MAIASFFTFEAMQRLLLFLTLIFGCSSAFPQAKVKWGNTKVDFGTVKEWDSPEATFSYQVSGRGSTMFLPQKYRQDLQVIVPAGTIRPGDSGEITIRYFTNQTGSFKKSVNLYHSASNQPVKITISGNIKSIMQDALTACPKFGAGSRTSTTAHKNVVIAVDRVTGNPLSDVSLKLLEEGDAKIQTRTSPKGRSTHKIGTGKYRIYATKEGYHPTAAEVKFDRGHATHWIYMDPIGIDEVSVATADVITEPQEEETEMLSDSRWTEPDIVNREDLPTNETEEMVDMGVGLNDQWIEEEIASSTENRWSELETIRKDEPADEAGGDSELFDLGITTNDQWKEPDKVETNALEAAQPSSKDTIAEPKGALDVKVAISDIEEERKETETEIVVAHSEPESEFSERSYRQNNLVLLLDVSASMKKDDKMIKLKSTITRVVGMLRDVDVLTIIAYNIKSWEVLPPTPVKDNEMIISMIDTLTPFGYTNGVKGVKQAYASLRDQFIAGGNNQLILATDGKFNSSKFSEKDALDLVKANAGGGSILSIIGFGEDKEATRMMKKMAKAGEGAFLQIKGNEDPTELLAEEIKMRSRK